MKQRLAWFLLMWVLVVAGCREGERPATTTPILTATVSSTAEVTEPPATLAQPPTITPAETSVPATPEPPATPEATPIATATPESPKVRFAVIGDYGQAGEAEAAVAELVKGWEPDLIITTGDNNYPDGEANTIDENIGQYYADFIHPYEGAYGPGAAENRFFPSPGNHDWQTSGLAPYLDYFSLPGNERYYDFVWGPVHFFVLDSDSREPDGVTVDSIQAQWLRERMAGSEAPWRVVTMHHAAYSSGRHGSTRWMRWPFAEWGASAVLAGHDHVYERLEVDGLPYFTNGLGGHPARYSFLLPHSGSQARYNDDHGAMLVEADEDRMTLTFVNVGGEVVDQFSLAK